METPEVCSTKFDADLMKIEHYQKYPVMLPFIGSAYGGPLFKPFLIVAESFCFPSKSKTHREATKWYAGCEAALDDVEVNWINTRHIVDQKKNGKWNHPKGHKIHIKLENAMMDAISDSERDENLFRHVAYMNYYQRPGIDRKGLDPDSNDQDVARIVFEGVLAVIKPEAVIFVSKKAWDSAKKSGTLANECQNEVTPHPCCTWWNRKSKRGTGKEIFTNFVRNQRHPSP
jgi:hypothetical protein